MKNFNNETDGQIDFYNKYIKRIDNTLTFEDILGDNNDGVLNGNLIEFKLNINDTSSVLFQAIKYLSAMRVKGKSIPANIVLISLNDEVAYCYKSQSYLNEIEQVYVGGASKNNAGFCQIAAPTSIDYSDGSGKEELISTLKENTFTKINIDENCIIGWAIRYYRERPNAKKSDFLGDDGQIKIRGEIRRPIIFKEYINEYLKETNIRFHYLMDKLNDDLSKKDLGAFYTPTQYSEKALELVRDAIKRVPVGNDYIILDRCAGTGNLELLLTDEELSHCVVSTYEYYEYKVLMELIGDKVKHVIPPIENEETYNNGNVLGADALSQEYIENKLVMSYVNNPKYTIIMLENPPYAEVNGNTRGANSKAIWKNSYAVVEMKKVLNGKTSNDLANIFIWTAFNYYLRQDTDSYILFSPIKYWKSQHLIDKKFFKGFAFNRKHFHTNTEACISCIYWGNESSNITNLNLDAFNIVDSKITYEGELNIKKVYSTPSKMFDDKIQSTQSGLACELNGLETLDKAKITVKTAYDQNIVAYLICNQFGFDNPRLNSALLTCARYDGHGSYITKDDFLFSILKVKTTGFSRLALAL